MVMRLAAQFPQYHDDTTGLRAFVTAAEEYGLHRLWLGDHVAWPVESASKYPFTTGPDDERFGSTGNGAGFLNSPNHKFLEALTTAGFIIGASSTVQVGLSVLILPMRNIVLAAKQLASIDVLGGGRLAVGVGAGWLREEFDLLGAPFENRYRRMEEGILALRSLWGSQPGSFSGEFLTVPPNFCEPRPCTLSGPPIMIGGHSAAALQRAAQLGDGLILSEVEPTDVKRIAGTMATLLRQAGRRADAVPLIVLRRLRLGAATDVSAAAEIIASYNYSGCDEFALYSSPSRSAADNAARLQLFAKAAELADIREPQRSSQA